MDDRATGALVRRRPVKSLGFVFSLACAVSLPAQVSPAPDTVDRVVASAMAARHIPGVAIAIVRDGKVVRSQGYGFADVERRVPVTPQTVFKIGSVSKQLIAAGILLLAEDGKIQLTDSLSRFYAGTPDHWRGITVRHFLTHTSGVRREGPAFRPMDPQPDSVVVRSAFAEPLEFATGSKYQYCNVCYFALADVITRVSGRPWDAFIADRVFQPLGMTSTTTTNRAEASVARGYSWRDGAWVRSPDYLAVRPSGAFSSTVVDLTKWALALDGDRLLRAPTRSAMWTRAPLTDGTTTNYGFGWVIDSADGRARIHHGGSLPGFRAELMRIPADRLTIIVLTNADEAQPAEIARQIALALRLPVRKES